MVAAYLRYRWQAGTLHGLHSPFVYALYRDVIRDRHPAPPGESTPTGGHPGESTRGESTPGTLPIETLRQQLLKSPDSLTVTDLGAGSRRSNGNTRPIAQIARNAQTPVRYARLLHRLIGHVGAKNVLELGTSLGLTTAYMANAVNLTGGTLHTFEGCPNTAALARTHLDALGYESVNVVVGNLDQTLGRVVANLPRLDLVFFDANHRYTPTLQYFMTCLPKVHNNTVFIFDDIHWSTDMERAWKSIKDHAAVCITIDLFGVGLVFFRRQQPKQHFTLRF